MTQHNDPTPPVYISFTWRLYASIIDTFLLGILLLPILEYIANFILPNGTASRRLAELGQDPVFTTTMERLAHQGRTLDASELLVRSVGVESWATEQLFYAGILGIIIIIFWRLRSASPGKILLGMKIVDAKTGNQPNGFQWFIRFLSYTVSALPFCLGFFWMAWDKRRQCFHDKIARTVVIKDTRPFKERVGLS